MNTAFLYRAHLFCIFKMWGNMLINQMLSLNDDSKTALREYMQLLKLKEDNQNG